MSRWTLLCLTALTVAAPGACPAQARTERIAATEGKQKAVSGSIQGYASVSYLLRARSGQRVTVALKTSNRSSYFNLAAPSSEAAMFNGSVQGNRYFFVAPATGDYVINVYLMRNAARRQEKAAYTLTVATR